MPQSCSDLLIHLIFSTKHRQPFLRDPEMRYSVHRYLATCLKTLESPAILINGTEDHVHGLFSLSGNVALKTVVEQIKGDSSSCIKRLDRTFRDFAWQQGDGAFSVSASDREEVRRYIMNQQQHHRRLTYQEEFRRICAHHELAIDERYVWD